MAPGCNLGVALEQETSLIDFSGESRNSDLVPGIRDPKFVQDRNVSKSALMIQMCRQGWSKNRTGENRTGEPRPSTRGPFNGHLRGMFRGESLKG